MSGLDSQLPEKWIVSVLLTPSANKGLAMEELKTTSFNNTGGSGKDNPGFEKEDGIVDNGMNQPPANASPSFVRANNGRGRGIENTGFDKEDEFVVNGMNKHPAHGRSSFVRKIAQPFTRAKGFCQAHSKVIKTIGAVVLLAGYLGFFIAACVLDFHRALALMVITAVVAVFTGYELVNKFLGDRIIECFRPVRKCFKANMKWMKWVFILVILGLLVTWLVLDTSKRPEQLTSFGGVCMFIIILFLCSTKHSAVSWRAVFWGLGLQFALGLFIIRTDPGFEAFNWLGKQMQIFLDYTKAGSGFVFGEALITQAFAFQALPIVIFFSCVMSVLYYVGVMQWLIIKIAWLMQVSMGTSPTESLSVAGNIFVGQTEAPLLIRPYLPEMTKSEIHAVMTGGFATIAGSVLGAYISFGIDASSLIAASVMAAPCALALSKLSYPETEETKFKNKDEIKIDSGEQQNILEAASNGASDSIGLVANIAANLIAFLAVLEFINAALRWLGGMVDYPELSFQLICSYIFMPVTYMMGISWEDSFLAAELIGTKLFLNEFVAYEKLSAFKSNRFNGLEEYINGQKQWVSMRTETICTFALCGFANFSSVGIMLGGLSSIAPSRKSDIANIVIRALLTGTCVSLVNASVAGILYVPDCVGFLADSHFNSTSPDLLMCCKELFGSTVILGNGTVSFDGIWSGADSKYFSGCCALYNNTVCTGL
ncbi:sodium/nucleoside cotransporter 1-like isoform X1 [Acipenser oxyrinchus oxyrinchus]|uniref:Sodium/nucleoside cotransporter n=1 Tax=Acipenser oxyrinchus oxyrinchus TaxID=40147 RepID=A0AAD8FYV3_ACIOX|nr:sodium/nucleoside cotransporter 1-like isoform X1 [Acipenser oxyrinchus oxyrinchus]